MYELPRLLQASSLFIQKIADGCHTFLGDQGQQASAHTKRTQQRFSSAPFGRKLNHQQMTGAIRRTPPPLVINLRSRDVPVTEQLLDLADIDGAVEQQRGVGGAQRMGRVNAALAGFAVLAGGFFQGAGQPLQIA